MTERSMITALALVLFLGTYTTSASAEPVVGPAPQNVEDVYLPRPPGYRVVPWVQGLEVPWSLVFLPDGRALVSERPGRIRLIRDGALQEDPYAVLDTVEGGEGLIGFVLNLAVGGEGGLMGLAVHPRFPEEPYIYAMHTYRGPDGVANRVIRLEDRGNRARFDRVIIDGIPGGLNHNGGRIAFGPDGMLYVTTGETFDAELAADLDALGGKILRLTPEGKVPRDNPFPGSPVYSFGHRNPQGIAWHPETGDLFSSEHGPSGEFGLGAHDEINVVKAGGDYGWPNVVGAPGREPYIDPIVVWRDTAVPPAGMTFYHGDLFIAVLGSGALLRIGLAQARPGYRVERIERWFASGPHTGQLGRIRDVVVGPDDRLYILTSNRDGRGSPGPGDDKIYRLEPGS
ncbi:MAG: PQQ-dependent sugar dehydrogenase [Alphaproteobacteria bacterium]